MKNQRLTVPVAVTTILASTAMAQCKLQDLPASTSVPPLGIGIRLASGDGVLAATYVNAGDPADGHVLVFGNGPGGWQQRQEISAWDVGENFFGRGLAIQGPWIAVGAITDSDAGLERGAVYMFQLQNGLWQPHSKILPPPVSDFARFGNAIDIDGDTMVVGASGDFLSGGRGSVHFYELIGGSWTLQQSVVSATNRQPFLGEAVAVHGDLALLGAPCFEYGFGQKSGTVYVYERSFGSWTQTHQLAPSNLTDHNTFGESLDLDAEYAVVGSPGLSEVYLYDPQDFNQAPLVLQPAGLGFGDDYGDDVALEDGVLIAGAPGYSGTFSDSGAAFVHRSPTWAARMIEPETPESNGRFGRAVALDGIWALLRDGNGDCVALDAGCVRGYSINDCLGTEFCPGVPNSTGLPGLVTGTGDGSAQDVEFHLVASQLPQGRPGIFLVGQGQGTQTPPGSQGTLCLGGSAIARFRPPGTTGPTGVLVRPVDLGNLPFNPPVAVQPGETWNFQAWYRDQNPTSTSNFTGAIGITFL